MMKYMSHNWINTLLIVAVGILVLVGGNQSGVGAGTRFPSGLSADGTSPSSGEVRGTTLTSTGAATLNSAVITNGATVGTTLAVTGASTLTGAVTLGSTISGGMLASASSTSATIVLTAAQSGRTVVIETTGAAYTLPAVTNTGATYKFYVGVNFSTNAVITSAEGDNISGGLQVNSLPIPCVDEDFITFVADGEIVGDYVELTSIGTGWLITGSSIVASGKATCTDPS